MQLIEAWNNSEPHCYSLCGPIINIIFKISYFVLSHKDLNNMRVSSFLFFSVLFYLKPACLSKCTMSVIVGGLRLIVCNALLLNVRLI